MTVSSSDIPEYEPFDNDQAVEVKPFSFLKPGGIGDFRPVPVEVDPKE